MTSFWTSLKCPKDILDPDVPDTEDPELLRQLAFVSPKQGVFRPVNSSATTGSSTSGKQGGKKKQNCSVM